MKEFALQLYSVREETEKDFAKTMQAVADMGYTGVEFAGYGDFSAKDMKALLDQTGLKAVSSHVSYEVIRDTLSTELEYLNEIGCSHIVCPWAWMGTEEDAKSLAEFCDTAAEKCAMAGIGFSYHNHEHEFTLLNEKPLMYHMLDNCSELVGAQFDLYWIKCAGWEPEDAIRKYAGRIPLMHLKQFGRIDGENCNVGFKDGLLNFKELTRVAALMGTEHFIVEQEPVGVSNQTILETCRDNADYLKNI